VVERPVTPFPPLCLEVDLYTLPSSCFPDPPDELGAFHRRVSDKYVRSINPLVCQNEAETVTRRPPPVQLDVRSRGTGRPAWRLLRDRGRCAARSRGAPRSRGSPLPPPPPEISTPRSTCQRTGGW